MPEGSLRATPGNTPVPVAASPYTIVIADDTATVRLAVARAVEAEPAFELVGQAVDGPSAVELVRAVRPDLALLDVVMPAPTGPEVVTLLREEGIPTTFVLMSSIEENDLALRSAHAGAASFADKARGAPFIVEVALAMARRWEGMR